MQIIQESPIIKELMEKGREEGKREATLNALRQSLTLRFNADLSKLSKRLDQLDLTLLEQLNAAALTAQSLADFETVLADRLAELETE